MRWKPLFLTLGLTACLMVVAQAAPGNGGSSAAETVGDFAVKLATALGNDASTPGIAANALRARGVDLTDDLHARLTEGEAARIMRLVGVAVVEPANPAGVVSASKATSLAGFASLQATHGYSTENGNFGKVLGCFHSVDRAACISCCDGVLSGPIGHQICSVLCKLNQPPPPSSSCPRP